MEISNNDYTNRLAGENSPYLLQHAHNPVDWYPWGEEAFKQAETENKPIFLSIGYSTCHWCHVMEKESFEDTDVAELMNRAFVSIKVDREVRPDLDAIFMEAAMMLGSRGGWPLNLVLTPERRPFFAATYIPKKGNGYMKGMLELVPEIEALWRKEHVRILDTAEQVVSALKTHNAESESPTAIIAGDERQDKIKNAAAKALKQKYDPGFGGFGPAPKFPQPQNLLFLLRRYNSEGDALSLEMVENTLSRMSCGGLHDHLGGGFHRYSTDREWKLPHFEKMLYDQAMLLLAYTETYQLTRKPEYRRTAENIVEYVLRDLRSPGGGFYSAEDADSEGREGRFYLWEYKEFIDLLNRRGFNGKKYADYFNLELEGNFTEEASGLKTGENILEIRSNDASPPAGSEELARARSILFQDREKRPRPHKDDKLLTDWNGLMIFALAKASRVFNNDEYMVAAGDAAGFILKEMKQDDGSLLHSWRSGRGGTLGVLGDYAFLIRGLLELYRTGFDPAFLGEAASLSLYAVEHFEDKQNGGFFQSDRRQTDLLLRKKNLVDNALPSGNSVMYENLMQLFKLTGDTTWRDSAEGVLKTAADQIGSYPSAFCMLLSAFEFAGPSAREIVITGNSDETMEMLEVINRIFMPGCVVILKTAETATAIAGLAGYTESYPPAEPGKAAVYICTGFTCGKPVTTAEELKKQLRLK